MGLRFFCCSYPKSYAIIFIPLISSFVYPQQACNQIDHDSLLSISRSSPDVNWATGTTCCVWEGIVCDQTGRVTRLQLPSKGLTGSIPPSLGNLTHLSCLNLSHNSLTGPLPGALFSSLNLLQTLDLSFNDLVGESFHSSYSSYPVALLQTVDLSSNRFHGKVESFFFQAAGNLVYFNISNNRFSGPLPSACTNSSLVKVLDFSSNNFGGEIPLGFGECSKLEVFNAGFNHLSGEIPHDIYRAHALREISLPSNKLVGSIGRDIIRLANLTVLELHTNNLNGTLPFDIGKLSNLEKLLLHVNGLSGTLPASLFNCTNLQKLSLLANSFQGDVTNLEFSKLHKLTTLDLGYNNFTGQLPKSLYSCKSLKAIRWGQNKLVGEITHDILALQSLTFLSLSFNKLTNVSGAIEILMGLENLKVLMISGNFLNEALPNTVNPVGFKNLQLFSMGRCQLMGQVPRWLEKLPKLMVLDLAANKLKGSIPRWLGTLPNLFYINLHSNFLSGEFPQTFTGLPAMLPNASQSDKTYLDLPIILQLQSPKPGDFPARVYNKISNIQPMIDLHNNSLSGKIPTTIGKLKLLISLDLNHNEFSGEIPDQISNLSNLETLDLSHNNLSGQIPHYLGDLCFLSAFNVSFNDLVGAIPEGTEMRSLEASAFVGNPGLCGPPLLSDCNKKSTGKEGGANDQDDDEEEEEEGGGVGNGNLPLYVSAGVGFIVGFWGVCGSLVLNPSWRSAYFRFLMGIWDWVYVTAALHMSKRRTQL